MKDTVTKFFLKKINDLIDILNWIDNEIESNSDKNSKVDSELSDWLHLIENNNLTDKESLDVMKKIKDLRLKRRSVKNEYFLLNIYKENKMKAMHQAQREFFKNEITKKWHELNMPYNNRVLTNDDIDSIFDDKSTCDKETHKKRGRKSSLDFNEVVSLYEELGTCQKVAEKLAVATSTISTFLRNRSINQRRKIK